MWIFCTCTSLMLLACTAILIYITSYTAPVAWPMAKLLDYVLGANEANTYKKAELKFAPSFHFFRKIAAHYAFRSFLQFHRQGEEPLRDDEISILNGVLELNNKKVEGIMTHMQVCFCLVMTLQVSDSNLGCSHPQRRRCPRSCNCG